MITFARRVLVSVVGSRREADNRSRSFEHALKFKFMFVAFPDSAQVHVARNFQVGHGDGSKTFISMVTCEREARCHTYSSYIRNKTTNSLLEMKTSSSNYRLLILSIWFLCICSLCSSARIIGDQRWGTSGDDVLQCNNTVQGRYLLSDSRGYVCNIMAVDPATACCPEGGDQYSCQGCNTVSQCCNSYEYCVSCCLNPMRTALEVALKTKLARQATAGMWTSLFDYCSGRCRHNSESVIHENAYVSGEHHCFSAKSTPPGEAVEANSEDELADVSVIVGGQGLSCESTCSAAGLSCREDRLAALNNCAELQQYNECKGLCISSTGPDQPAEVVSGAPEHLHPGACLYSTQVSQLSCKGYHPFTRRLCPCA